MPSQRGCCNSISQVWHSQVLSGVAEEKDLITRMLGIILKRIKFIDSDTKLSAQWNIAMVMYKEMQIAENFRNVWWEQVKRHVQKKLDERQSNC